jgi:hypothetical protein
MASEAKTGTRDVTYNLVSNLYHSLQAADTCEQYIRDAQEDGDRELEEFFRDCQEQNRDLAERAKNLLGAKLGQGVQAGQGKAAGSARKGRKAAAREEKVQTNASVNSGGRAGDDVEDELSKESFPASDSPAKY